MQWFGESWAADVCLLENHVPTPVGEPCACCAAAIGAADRGVVLMHSGEFSQGVQPKPWHLGCLREHLGQSPPQWLW